MRNPRIIILADSNAWGGSIGPSSSFYDPGEAKLAWPVLLDNARGKADILNAARGGERAIWVTDRLPNDLTPYSPDFVIYALGTNDADATTWLSSTQTVLAAIAARGAQPILTTVPPKASMTVANVINAYMLPGGTLAAYPLIDFAYALSVGGDRQTINTAFYNADNTHFNVAGHAAVFAQIKADAPFLIPT